MASLAARDVARLPAPLGRRAASSGVALLGATGIILLDLLTRVEFADSQNYEENTGRMASAGWGIQVALLAAFLASCCAVSAWLRMRRDFPRRDPASQPPAS
jgi:hypothetical protein